MSKLFQRKGFRLASVAYFLSLGTLAVALFAWFSTSSTFSWFASNKTVDATGMAIKVKTDDEVDINVEVYKYVEKKTTEEVTSDGVTSTVDVGTGEYHVQKLTLDDVEGLGMSRYDQVFQEDNDYAPILMKLTLTGGTYEEDTALPLKISRNRDYDNKVIKSEGATPETISKDDTQYHLSSYISSVISVKAMVDNTTTITDKGTCESVEENLFKTMRDKFEETDSEKIQYKTRFFVQDSSQPSAGPVTKKNVNFSDAGSDAEGVSGNLLYTTDSSADSSCTVYVWIDYDETTTKWSESFEGYNGLINAYIKQMKGNSLGINVSYKLECDITQISVLKSDLANSESSSSN